MTAPPVQPESELILWPSRSLTFLRLLFLLAVTAGYVALASWYPDFALGWLCAGCVGIFALLALRQLFDRSTYLRLTARGFGMYDRSGVLFFAWSEVRGFQTGGRGNVVVFDYVQPSEGSQQARSMARFLVGGDGALPSTYGLTAPELARLLNEWRERYASHADSTSS